MPNEIKIPLIVDIAVVVSVVFGGGIMWQKVDVLANEVASIKTALESTRLHGDAGRTTTVDRLARVETKVEMLTEKIESMDEKLDRALRR